MLLPRFIKPLKTTDIRGGYNFGLCCPGWGGGSAILGCLKGEGGGHFPFPPWGGVDRLWNDPIRKSALL